MISNPLVSKLIDLAIEEDLSLGDPTSEFSIPAKHQSSANIIAKEDLILCGAGLIEPIVHRINKGVVVTPKRKDGESLKAKECIATLEGPTRALLAAERTILNFLQHLSAVATHTQRVVSSAKNLVICDTRKTTPGWRVLEKFAVRVGGGANHRMSLGDMVLVKNNHVDAHGGGIEAVVASIRKGKPYHMSIEVEVRDLTELAQALSAKVEAIMLDNMDDAAIASAMLQVKAANYPVRIEVSGRVKPERFAKLAELGVNCASMSSLVHGLSSVDISMRIQSR